MLFKDNCPRAMRGDLLEEQTDVFCISRRGVRVGLTPEERARGFEPAKKNVQ